MIQSDNYFLGWGGLRLKCPQLRKPKLAKFLQSSMRIILLNIGILKSLHTTVPKHAFHLGGLDFGLYEPFEYAQDTLLQQWLKSLIAASRFVNYVTEIVIITRSVKLRAFVEYKSRPTMNTHAHTVMIMGIVMMIMMSTITSKVTPPVLTAHQVTWKRKRTVF